ncbi:molybdopterin molybdotransferase MoeA [Cyanobium sp. BA5m-21]|uniref:molybdopterin molybdotransferase MoeA n=1 Tax=unclassified Cyanobium TaxID=2627006 RepID=UPI0020CF64EF|nr:MULTISPECIES: molybdopterin molybdotransferase MoeA [unclassified Cyanobium]MCP9904884.1 molybdopterin molybdotransferase MoeA [Cyanobium sp. BA5m-10]MCP9905935.1 molybdopterin molybdotransferase MoeA [Cyanobium sp. BA5m-21]MCP9913430.1 molybdopterin molybdotransferase MoeA [Cyanobium sp. BA20m-14]
MSEPFGPEGLPLDQARAQILESLQPLGRCEALPLAACLGRITAERVLAAAAVPGFRASIMDGYAIAGSEQPLVGARWRLRGTSAAGAPYGSAVAAGEAVRILTGAVVPAGSARVLPQELVQPLELPQGPSLELVRPAGPNPWIRGPEEEAAVGQELVAVGCRLGAAELGRLASCGVQQLTVTKRPRLGLLISGDELLSPGLLRGPGQIWESNSVLLAALLEQLGYGVTQQRLVADQPEPLRQALRELAAGCDVVVSTGGVSAGDSDWIRQLVGELGEVSFWKLFLKPGRPFAWGEVAGVPFFGLPGNPVAAAITALQLLWPALQRLEGGAIQVLPRLRVRLDQELRRGAGRPELARAQLVVAADGGLLARVEGSQASSRIGSLQGADLLLEIPAELGNLEAGTQLWAQLLRLPIF